MGPPCGRPEEVGTHAGVQARDAPAPEGIAPHWSVCYHQSSHRAAVRLILAPAGCSPTCCLLFAARAMADRVCIFIDGSNFYSCLKESDRPVNIAFGKLSAELVGARPDRRLTQLYYYNCPLPRPAATDPDFARKEGERRRQQRFLSALRYVPHLTFRAGRLQRLPGGALVEKKVDVMLATDLLVLAVNRTYDVGIVVSCDADYSYAIEAVKRETGVAIELAKRQPLRTRA